MVGGGAGEQSPSVRVLQRIGGHENRESAASQGAVTASQAPRGAGQLTAAQKLVAACLANEPKDLSRVSTWKAGPTHHKKNNGRIKSMDLANIQKVKINT